MAPVPTPHAAARPVICHGPLYRLLMLLPSLSRVCHGSLYGLPLLLSLSPHSAMCHFQVSSHCWWFPFFVIGCCMASHCCCHPPPHCGSTLWFWPRDWPNGEVCGDSKIERHSSACHTA
ncbi:unnamed protein product [Staurois parvus]|uniref:Uncharacterized protein n=1 Tax=Staurois parvus TaxID=386267 RepID=A0ABN9CCM7_9NEOB|nr:unnamed protein product [Staurois parvus]